MSSRPRGIRSDQDVFRKVITSPPGELKIRSRRPVAVYIDPAPDGVLRVAYLIGSSVSIFQADPRFPRFRDGGEALHPAPLNEIRIDEEGSNKWTGVALGGQFLAVWGTSGKGTRALLQVIKIISNKTVSFLEIPHDDIRWFDADKRVAVSRMGYIALIRYEKLVVVNLNSELAKTFTYTAPRNAQPFTDVAFNETGDLLYAWAAASLNEPSAGLFIYRVEDGMVSKSYYNPCFNDSLDAKLIPYNTQIGCIIAADNQYYYPAVTNTKPGNDTTRQRRNYSQFIRKSHLKASTMFNNHSLIAIQKANVFQHRYRLVEHPLHLEGTSHYFGDPIELAKVEMKAGAKSEIKAVQAGGDICIFIFSLDGRYEMIRFEGPRGRSDDQEALPEADKDSRPLVGNLSSELVGLLEAEKESTNTGASRAHSLSSESTRTSEGTVVA